MMSKLENLQVAIRKYYPYFFLPLIVIYVLFNIFDGNNGLLSHARLDAETAVIENKIKEIKKDNNLLEIKIASLNNLDAYNDLIDEQIRDILGYGIINEYVIFFDNE